MSLTPFRLITIAIVLETCIFAIIVVFKDYKESDKKTKEFNEETKALNEEGIKKLTDIQRALAEEYLDNENHTEPLTLRILSKLETKRAKRLNDERQHTTMQEQLKIIKNKKVWRG